ncbi:hypothetical protein SAMN05428949_6895 [Chitinophaga sp. YR627]|nr:hypothetical protein SAMN05428949_6895 [Chitinophaga sp. YR627]
MRYSWYMSPDYLFDTIMRKLLNKYIGRRILVSQIRSIELIDLSGRFKANVQTTYAM